MPSYTRSLFHIVFATRNRRPTLSPACRRDFLAYCCGIFRGMGFHVYRINCVDDHLHALVGLPATLDLATMIKRLKLSSGKWLREHPAFPEFDRWQEKYGAFSVSWEGREAVIEYMRNQEAHHRRESYLDEFRRLLNEAGLTWDPRDEGESP